MAIRKKFSEVEIPSIESTLDCLGTSEELDKKTIKLDLSRKMRGRGIEITFEIKNLNGKLIAFPKKIHLIKSYIQRMMRKRTNYIEDSFIAPCKDIRAIVKPFLITRKKVSRAVRKNLRNIAREFLITHCGENEYLNICDEIISGELQRIILPKLKRIYPLSFSDIRIFETKELEKAKLPAVTKKPEIKETSEKESLVAEEETKEIVAEEKEPAKEKAEKTTKKKETKSKESKTDSKAKE